MNYEDYIKAVVNGLLEKWPEKFRKYTGMDYKGIETMIMDLREEWSLIKRTVGDLYEYDISVEEAIEELYCPLNQYVVGSGSVM